MNTSYTIDRTWFTQCLHNQELVDRLKDITLIICDIDGSLTDGTIYVTGAEEVARGFSVVDGFAFKPAQQAGIAIAFMSGKHNNSILVRAKTLGIPEHLVVQGVKDKCQATKDLLASLGKSANNLLIFGDDVLDASVKIDQPDYLFVCPNDAPFYIQATADLVLPRCGGRHTFRLLLDLMLFIRNKHPMQTTIQSLIHE
ncbi:MAG: hypothetical protein WCT20_05690 [Candidatus Babeliales bacterium]